MARLGILTCSNATQDLGCSSVSCLADVRKRKGTFTEYAESEKLTLVGIINCPGCNFCRCISHYQAIKAVGAASHKMR